MYNLHMQTLKPQDIAILLKILLQREPWTFAGIAAELYLSASEVHAGLRRASQAGLFQLESKKVNVTGLEEFLIHGIRYVFLVSKGELTRGMPTSIAAPPLVFEHFPEVEVPPVWPHPMGLKRGYAIEPLYKRLPEAAALDSEFYHLIALTDALRERSPRVRKVASELLHHYLRMFKGSWSDESR